MKSISGVSRALAVAVASASLASCSATVPGDSPSAVDIERTTVSTDRQVSPSITAEPAPTVSETVPPPWVHRPIELVELQRAATVPVFFGHRSVGGNVIDGINALFKDAGLQRPPLVDLDGGGGAVPAQGGYIAHGSVGRNGEPLGKLMDFDSILRQDRAPGVQVALLKLCYADVEEHTDTEALFQEYQETMTRLERDLPEITFLHATVPLTTDNPVDNIARGTYNSLMRAAYGDTGRLWDLATIESTTPDGHRVGGVISGDEYQALHPAFSTDGGHLNDQGARLAAAPLLELVARHSKS